MDITKKISGFTLMELIAVMAVMAILAGSLAPSIFDQIKRAKADAEEQNLVELISSLKLSIIDTKTIPTSEINSWVSSIALSSSINRKDIEYNSFGYRRRLVFDPRFLTNSDSIFPGLTQNQGLENAPVSPRVMLISDLTQNVSSISNSSTVFDDIWEQNSDANIIESSNVKIVRLSLNDRFHRIILTNESTEHPSYQLEDGSIIDVPVAHGGIDGSITRYVLSNTRISLREKSLVGVGVEQTANLVNSDWTSRYQTNGTTWFWGKP